MRSLLFWLVVLALVGVGSYYAANMVFDRTLKGEIDAELAVSKKTVEIDYRKVHYNMLDRQTEMHGIRARLPGSTNFLKIDKAVLHRFDEEFPDYAHFTATGVHIEQLTNLPAVRARLDALGISDVPVDLELDYEYDSYKNNLDVRKLILSAEGLGQLDVSLELLEFEPRKMAWSGDSFDPLTALNLSLKKAEITYEDQGLAARVIDQAASSSGKSREAWIESQLTLLSEQYQTEERSQNAQLVGSWERFLRSPSSLKLVARPQEPASVVMLIFSRRERVPLMLGLQLTNR